FVMVTLFAYLCLVVWRFRFRDGLTAMVLVVGTGILLAILCYRPKEDEEDEQEQRGQADEIPASPQPAIGDENPYKSPATEIANRGRDNLE
ncbi:MAG TPA: hypothetical protein VGY55_01125, partial [Pirellulales bacterium]|nr:hypothetical protein [Pirellulales bacterium]